MADPLLRAMLWQSLWDGVRDGHMPLNDFIQTALNNAPAEKDYSLLGDVLGKVTRSARYLDEMQADSAYLQRTRRAFEDMAWAGLQASKGNSDFTRRWFGQYLAMASSKGALDRLAALLDGKESIAGMPINQDLRWTIIARLNRFDRPGSLALIDAELARDQSDAGQAAALAATVTRPDPKLKAEWLAKIADLQTKLPFSKVRTAMGSLYPAEQSALSEATAAVRLAKLPEVDQVAGPVYMRAFAASMIPANCTPASVQRLESAVRQYQGLSAGTRRALLNTHEEDKRCVAIKQAMTVPQT